MKWRNDAAHLPHEIKCLWNVETHTKCEQYGPYPITAACSYRYAATGASVVRRANDRG